MGIFNFIKSNNYVGTLSNNSNCEHFSSKSSGILFKKTSNFKDGDESAQIFLAEHDFRIHNGKFSQVLGNIRQTESEQKEFIQEVARIVVHDGRLEPQQVLNAVLSSTSENQEVKQAVLTLSDKAIRAAEKCPMRPGVEEGLKESVTNVPASDLTRWNDQGLGFKDLDLVDLPAYKSLVTKFTSQLDLGSDAMQSIDILIELSNTNELITFLSANHMLIKGLGLPMFMISYYSMGGENSFKTFLGEVRDLVEWKTTPMYRSLKVSFLFIYKHKFKVLISTTSLSGFVYHLWFLKVKAPLIEALPLPPIPKLELKLESQWSPTDPLTKGYFTSVRGSIGSFFYMITNTVSSAVVGGREGVIDAVVTPETRLKIEEGVNKVVPVIVDAIKEYGETVKKKEK